MELVSKVRGALCMQLNRDNACTCFDERSSYRSSSCTNVENKFTG
jgi:hypothetical protein